VDFKQILLLIGIGLYYYLQSRNKDKKTQKKPTRRPGPQAPQTNPTPTSNPKTTLEDILRELVEEEPPRKPEPRAKIKHVEIDKSVRKPKSAETTPRSKPVKRIKRIEVEEIDASNFDLRQAVINDAILNRPDY